MLAPNRWINKLVAGIVTERIISVGRFIKGEKRGADRRLGQSTAPPPTLFGERKAVSFSAAWPGRRVFEARPGGSASVDRTGGRQRPALK